MMECEKDELITAQEKYIKLLEDYISDIFSADMTSVMVPERTFGAVDESETIGPLLESQEETALRMILNKAYEKRWNARYKQVIQLFRRKAGMEPVAFEETTLDSSETPSD